MDEAAPRGRQRRAEADNRELAFLKGFLATSLRMNDGDPERDALADIRQARRWLSSALADRAERPGVMMTDVFMEAHDLEPLRAFREDLRNSLEANRSEPVESPSRITTTVDLQWSADGGLDFRPVSTGWRGIAGLLVMDLLLAQANGRLHRLKTCAHKPCGYPFVDHSPNLTRAWDNTARCGNKVNLRASRARRKAATQS